jgi:hypothetical protein
MQCILKSYIQSSSMYCRVLELLFSTWLGSGFQYSDFSDKNFHYLSCFLVSFFLNDFCINQKIVTNVREALSLLLFLILRKFLEIMSKYCFSNGLLNQQLIFLFFGQRNYLGL